MKKCGNSKCVLPLRTPTNGNDRPRDDLFASKMQRAGRDALASNFIIAILWSF
jgi:hypothetical protein